MANQLNCASALDLIKERVLNIDRITIKTDVRQIISEATIIMAKREENLRKSTITINTNNSFDQDKIKELINNDWAHKYNPIVWQDKHRVFVKLMDEGAKIQLIEQIKITHGPSRPLAALIQEPDIYGSHFSRKLTRLEIQNAKANLKIDDILKQLKNFQEKQATFEEPKEGKLTQSNTRTLSFKTNGTGFELIFERLEGCITISPSGIKIWPKINIKPWSCRDCFQTGPNHKCTGKICANCGGNDHSSKDCKSNTRICSNCKAKGHRAKDIQCPKTITYITRELQRSDIPIKFYAEKHLRKALIASLQLK